MERISKYIRKNADRIFRALFLALTGHLLLLTAAICERGTTELSRALLPDLYLAGESVEAVVVSFVILFFGKTVLSLLFSKDTGNGGRH